MKKKDIFIIFVLTVFIQFLLPSTTKAVSIIPLSEEAVYLCRRTGGEIIEEVFCLCPDGTKQKMFVTRVEEWKGCKIANWKQLVETSAFRIKAFLQKYLWFLLTLLVLIEIAWTFKRLKEKEISRKQLLIIFLLAFFTVIGFGVWFYGFSKEEPPAILAQIYLDPFISIIDFLVKLGLDKSSLPFLLIFFSLPVFLGTVFGFFILLAFFLLISEIRGSIKKKNWKAMVFLLLLCLIAATAAYWISQPLITQGGSKPSGNLQTIEGTPPVLPDTKTNIQQVKRLICNLTVRGFADWVFVESAAEIPYQEGDFRNPADYANRVQSPHVEKADDHSMVTLNTWNEYGGLLSKWEATIEGDEVTFLRAEVIQVAIGYHTPLPTEGHFLPTSGSLLVNESPSSLNIGDKPVCRYYQTIEQEGKIVEVTGRIRSIGNDPFIQLVIETDNGVVYGLISSNKITGLWESQIRRAKVKGYLLGGTPPSFRTGKSIDVIDFEVIE